MNQVKNILTILILFSISFLGFFSVLTVAQYKMELWVKPPAEQATTQLPDWSYRQPIPISNSGSALTNYQVLVTLDTSSLITAGKMQSLCQDIRFIDSDGITTLNYWIESGCNSGSTKIWVKVPSVPSGSKTIYVYYGNPSATSQSNGTATFEFFDDFEGTSLNTNKWNSLHAVDAGTSLSVHDELLDFNVLSGYAGTGGSIISKTTLLSANYVIETKVKFTNFYLSALGAYAGFTNAISYDDSYYGNPSKLVSARLWDYYSLGQYLNLAANDIGSVVGTTPITIRNIWFRMKTIYTPPTYAKGIWTQLESPFAEQTLEKSGTLGIAPTYVAVGIGDYNTNEHTYFDFVLVRKYASTEPTVGIIKLKECTSTVPDFTCSYNYFDCSSVGIYQGNAQTFQGTTLLSQSGYQTLYTCYGTTEVSITPNYVFGGLQPVIVSVNISDTRYVANHTIYLNLTIDGIPWQHSDCNIAYINLTAQGTFGTPNCINCQDWPVNTISQDGNFSIQSTCTIPLGTTGGTHTLTVIPSVYSQPTLLNKGTANFIVVNEFIQKLWQQLLSMLGLK
jgi:hypothetical protein